MTSADLHDLGAAIAAGLVVLDAESSRRVADAHVQNIQTREAHLLTAEQAGRILGVSAKTLRRIADRNPRKLRPRYVCRDARWLRGDVETFAANASSVPTAKDPA